MEDYDLKLEASAQRNEKFLKEFRKWLENKQILNKTIDTHVRNVVERRNNGENINI